MGIIAVTGHKGRLGSYLVVKLGYLPLDCDITNPDSVKLEIERVHPDIIVNCAAYTDVDGAEKYYRSALNVNQIGVAILREEFEGWLIHMSTDYIFGGHKGPYSEDFDILKDPPKGRYGKSKSYGEPSVFSFPDRDGTIIRTTMLYGSPYKKNDFVNSVLKKLENKYSFKIPYTLIGSPTYIPHLAEGINSLIIHHWHNPPKVINIAGSDVISRYDFALMIASVWGKDKMLIFPVNEIPGLTPRPRKAGLRVGLAKKLHIPIYTVLEGLEAMKNVEKENQM